MVKVLGAKNCPDCIELKRNFDLYNIEYEFIDIQENLINLKDFLKLRDNNSFYDKAKEKGLIGIPTLILEDGKMTYYWKKYLEELGYKPLEGDTSSCNTKYKNC